MSAVSPSAGLRDPAELLIVGVSYKSASFDLRESLFLPEEALPERLAELRAAGFGEALLLATCDRTELLLGAADCEAETVAARDLLARWAGWPAEALEQQSYALAGEAALRHLFAVAAALDSQILGEPQILGQLRDSHRLAGEAGLGGPLLDRAVQAALQAARKVRGQTPLAERPVTLAAAALRVARDLYGELGRCSALILGLGEMGEILAGELRNAGLGDLSVCHPQELRAQTAAHRLRCHRRSWEEREAALVAADIVVAASGSGRYTIDRALAERVLKRRRRKPLFLVDAALPRDVEPDVEEVEGAFVYGLDDLERLAQAGRSHRESAAGAAWRLLDQELRQFRREQAEREGLDALLALRRHGEALRRQALAERGGDAAAATRLLLNRLLHDPSEVLRAAAAGDPAEREMLEKALARLFRLAPARGDRAAEDDPKGEDE